MKNKKLKSIVFSILLILLVLFLTHLIPWADLSSVQTAFLNVCVGRGCSVSRGQSMLQFSTVDCQGYAGYMEFGYWGLVCFPNPGLYCKYTHPFTNRDECLCEAEKRKNIDANIKYCSKDKKCYTNSWEYEFGCTDDMEELCSASENVFTSPDVCRNSEGSALSYGLVKREVECSNSWASMYAKADESQKKNIYNTNNQLCTLICSNCNSSLCEMGSVCEYVRYPAPNLSSAENLSSVPRKNTSELKQMCSGNMHFSRWSLGTMPPVADTFANYVDNPVEVRGNVSRSFQVFDQDDYLSVELSLKSNDLDLYLISPSGERMGFNNFTGQMNPVPRTSYIDNGASKSFYLNKPMAGIWTYMIYFKNASSCDKGGLYDLSIYLEGHYKPDVEIKITPENASLLQWIQVPVLVKNNGLGKVRNMSLLIHSKSLKYAYKFEIENLGYGENVSTEATLFMNSFGNIQVETVAKYSDYEDRVYTISNSTTFHVSMIPQTLVLYVYLLDQEVNDQKKDFARSIRFSIPKVRVNTTLDLNNLVAVMWFIPNSIVDSYEDIKRWSIFIDDKTQREGIEIHCGKGDLICDGEINEDDYAEFKRIYNVTCDDENYNLLADYNENCWIDANDSALFLKTYEFKKYFSIFY